MKPIQILLVLAILPASSPATAQCSDGQDEICIFWDLDADQCPNCDISEGDSLEAFVVLINPSQTSGVGGFEFKLVNGDGSPFPPPFISVLGYQLPLSAINISEPPQFVVGVSQALPWSPWITLLTINLLPLSTEALCFGLQPPTPSSLPNTMGYASGDFPGLVIPLYPCTGDGGFRIACLNEPGCPPPVAVERTSWGAIKGIFQ